MRSSIRCSSAFVHGRISATTALGVANAGAYRVGDVNVHLGHMGSYGGGTGSGKAAERKEALLPAIAKQLEMPNVDVLQSFKFGDWSIIYVDTHQSDEVFLFYAHDPLTSHYVTTWSGGAARDQGENIRSWAVQNAPGIPAPLARCFSWHVTKDRDL